MRPIRPVPVIPFDVLRPTHLTALGQSVVIDIVIGCLPANVGETLAKQGLAPSAPIVSTSPQTIWMSVEFDFIGR